MYWHWCKEGPRLRYRKTVDGIILAYLPGDQGAAIADIIAGKINPSGKLPFTYPKYNGVKMHYDTSIRGNKCKYMEK